MALTVMSQTPSKSPQLTSHQHGRTSHSWTAKFDLGQFASEDEYIRNMKRNHLEQTTQWINSQPSVDLERCFDEILAMYTIEASEYASEEEQQQQLLHQQADAPPPVDSTTKRQPWWLTDPLFAPTRQRVQQQQQREPPKLLPPRPARLYDNEADLESMRRSLGLEFLFDPVGDGSCLFGAIAAGFFSIPEVPDTTVEQQRHYTRLVKQECAETIASEFRAIQDRGEKEDFKIQVVLSLDLPDDMAHVESTLLRNFSLAPPMGDFNFVHWIRNVYAVDNAVQGGHIQFNMIPKSALACNLLLVDGDLSPPTMKDATRIVSPGSLLAHLLSVECYCRDKQRNSPIDEVVKEDVTIVIERFGGHYRLLGIADESRLEMMMAMRVILKTALDHRSSSNQAFKALSELMNKGGCTPISHPSSSYAARPPLSSPHSQDEDIKRHLRTIAKAEDELPFLYAMFYVLWSRIV